MIEATVQELKEAFKDSGLWRSGWTFDKAQSVPAVLIALRCSALAKRRKQGMSKPRQSELI